MKKSVAKKFAIVVALSAPVMLPLSTWAQSYSSTNGLGSTLSSVSTDDLNKQAAAAHIEFVASETQKPASSATTSKDKDSKDKDSKASAAASAASSTSIVNGKLTLDELNCVTAQLGEYQHFINDPEQGADRKKFLADLGITETVVRVQDNSKAQADDSTLNYGAFLGMTEFGYKKNGKDWQLAKYDPKLNLGFAPEKTEMRPVPGKPLAGKFCAKESDQTITLSCYWYDTGMDDGLRDTIDEYNKLNHTHIASEYDAPVRDEQFPLKKSQFVFLPASKTRDNIRLNDNGTPSGFKEGILYLADHEKVRTAPVLDLKAVVDSNGKCHPVKTQDLIDAYSKEWPAKIDGKAVKDVNAQLQDIIAGNQNPAPAQATGPLEGAQKPSSTEAGDSAVKAAANANGAEAAPRE